MDACWPEPPWGSPNSFDISNRGGEPGPHPKTRTRLEKLIFHNCSNQTTVNLIPGFIQAVQNNFMFVLEDSRIMNSPPPKKIWIGNNSTKVLSKTVMTFCSRSAHIYTRKLKQEVRILSNHFLHFPIPGSRSMDSRWRGPPLIPLAASAVPAGDKSSTEIPPRELVEYKEKLNLFLHL